MPADQLVADLTAALDSIPLIDPHSHIDPLAPVSKSLDDILGYHYYTELAHSAGMSQEPLGKDDKSKVLYTVVIAPSRWDDRLRWNMTASVTITPT